ncbi:MAG TPA: hypothetical protein VMK65_14020 [Longimicrobiales bacterium]|nr:hypothetical protein [Longimicrobiales bacterium]
MRGDEGLRADLLSLFARGAGVPLGEEAFEALALRAFRHQLAENAPYAAWCVRRRRTAESVERWSDIPAVPTAAFREVALVAGDPAAAQAVFRTSGTTGGAARRGEHHVLDLALYDHSLLATFRRFVLPDGARPRMLSLLAPASAAPDSSLAYMVSVLVRELGAEGSRACARSDGRIDEEVLGAALRGAESDGVPVLLLGTSFSFVHWLDGVRARGERYRLPAGSRLMDTGGYKGRSRAVAPDQLRGAYGELLGIPASHCVNEYGMTELCSQYYDVDLAEPSAGVGGGPRSKAGPPWLRPLAVDPETLEPLADGEVGLLRHVDLANLDSVVAVQTEDLGRVSEGRLQLLGRASGAAPRGCSLAVEELLWAAREGRP